MTALIDTLFQIEKFLGLELDSLMPYAETDTIGGYHPDEAQRKWWTGAIWEVEGKTLYAVMRALQPDTVVEIGSGTGCSATHICTALRDNGHGHMTTVDRGNTPQIPADLHEYVTMLPGDGIAYLALLPDASVDFILEDADHTTDMCQAIAELAKTKLKPGGVLFAHDAAHWAVGGDVRAGYDRAGLDFRVYLTDPSDCGWLVWKRPQADYSSVIDTTVLQAQEEPNMAHYNPSLFQPGTSVKVTDSQSKYFGQTGQVIDNYRSGLEAQGYAVRFDDGSEFWIHENDLELAAQQAADEPPTDKKVKRTRKAKAK